MKCVSNQNCKKDKKAFMPIFLFMAFLAGFFFLDSRDPAFAAPEEKAAAVSNAAFPQISANRIEVDIENECAEYTGDVIITHGATVTTADKVKVFFMANPDAGLSVNQNSFKKIVATGNVLIDSEDGVATADEAVYDATEKTLTMTGNPATFTDEAVSMSSREIIVSGIL